MRWYFPTWNGDIRAVANEKNADKTDLVIIDPTDHELSALEGLATTFHERKWTRRKSLWKPKAPRNLQGEMEQTVVLNAPVHEVGKILVKALKPGKQTLTAVVFENGVLKTTEGGDVDITALSNSTPEKAATVKRPTPCCPSCIPGAVLPASEVLLDFLSPSQHEDWARSRAFVARGNLTGHRYLVPHRHSALAQRLGKSCYDMDDRLILHFHDWSVPPEEEALAAKLCLENREHWLRNEATVFFLTPSGKYIPAVGAEMVFKNPFGDVNDGVADARLTGVLGSFAMGFNVSQGVHDASEVVELMLPGV